MKNHPLITDEAMEAATVARERAIQVRAIEAFLAHHEGERDCECHKGDPFLESGAPDRKPACPICNGTGKVREDRLVKLSEIVRLWGIWVDDNSILMSFQDYIEREFGGPR